MASDIMKVRAAKGEYVVLSKLLKISEMRALPKRTRPQGPDFCQKH